MVMNLGKAPALICVSAGLAMLGAAYPHSARADSGLHLGWCIGVGNQHHTANCPPGGSPVGITGPGGQTPSVTQPGPGTQTPDPVLIPHVPLPPTRGPDTNPAIAVPVPAPYRIPSLVPQPSPNRQPVAVPGQIPQPTPQARPHLVPYPTPNRQPVAVPGQVPQPTPQARPHLVPQPSPNRQPVAVPGQVDRKSVV